MKLKMMGLLLPAAMMTCSGFGVIVQAPWAPDTALTTEQNLYTVLGVADNATLNTKILNQAGGVATDWTVSTSDAAHYSSLLIEMAGNANANEFGIYEIGNTANRLTVFTGPAAPDLSAGAAQQLIVVTALGDTKVYLNSLAGSVIDLGGATSFGFYLDTKASSPYGTYFSVAADEFTSTGDTMQHVVALNVGDTLFGQAPYPTAGQSGYIMGWEDSPPSLTDYDYQDMVVSLTALPIPEPTTMIAGALLLLPFGASTIRIIRKRVS
jgi:hypothetical protein